MTLPQAIFHEKKCEKMVKVADFKGLEGGVKMIIVFMVDAQLS